MMQTDGKSESDDQRLEFGRAYFQTTIRGAATRDSLAIGLEYQRGPCIHGYSPQNTGLRETRTCQLTQMRDSPTTNWNPTRGIPSAFYRPLAFGRIE